MLRMQDFKCATHGLFEETLVLDPRDGDARFEAVRSHPCPQCGESAPGVWTKAPGLKGEGTWGMTIGGHTHSIDALDQKLEETRTQAPAFYERPDFGDRFMQAYKANEEKALAGTLEPDPEIAPEQVDQIAAAAGLKE